MTTSKANKDGGIKAAGKKMMERIKKLLRMADDVSSPNEAAIAARRAKAMMAEYNLTHADMLTASMSLDDFKEQMAGKQLKRLPRYVDILAVAVAGYTGCRVRKQRVPGTIKLSLNFQGEESDLAICIYLWTYLTRTIDRLCDQSGVKWIGPRNSFKMGCSSEIASTLRRMGREERANDETETTGKAMVLFNKKEMMLNDKFGIVKYHTTRDGVYDGGARAAGKEAGRGVSIRKGVNNANNARRLT